VKIDYYLVVVIDNRGRFTKFLFDVLGKMGEASNPKSRYIEDGILFLASIKRRASFSLYPEDTIKKYS
jgi:hypothetical protein